jgi:cystathionine beta-lyase/cystathionine gamma-synthase
MFDDKLQAHVLTAAEARDHVAELEAERALALMSGVAAIDTYMHDLEEEIDVWRHVFVMTGVTEIASLHGELFGANAG